MALPAILGALTRAVTSLGGFAKTVGKSVGASQLVNDLKYGFTQNIGIRLSSQIGGMISGLDEVEKVLLMNGTNLSKFNKDLATDFKNLNGSTLLNLRNAANLYSIGFRENNKNLLKVANIFDMTGQDTQGLLSVLPNLAFNLKLTSQGVNDLAITTLATGEKYGVATDKLINTITKLPIFETAAQASLKQFGTNLVDVVARMGALGPQVGNIVNALLTTEEGLRLSVIAGAGDLRKQLEKAANPKEFFRILMEIFRKVDAFAGPVKDQMKALGESQIGAIMGTKLLEKTYGPLILKMLGMGDSLDSFTLSISENAGKVDYTTTLFTAVAELGSELFPLYEIAIVGLTEFTKYLTATVQVLEEGIVPAIKIIGDIFQLYIKPFVSLFEGIVNLTKSLYQKIIDLVNEIGSYLGLEKIGGDLANAFEKGVETTFKVMMPIVPLMSSLAEKIADKKQQTDIRKIADATERQRDLAESEARRASTSPTIDRSTLSPMQMINRELMYAVTAMRIDERTSQQSANEQINLLKILVRNQARALAGDTSVPTKTRGGL